MKQLSLFDKTSKRRYGRTEYGGLKTKGHRKLERPFGPNRWIHLVLKSDKAYGKRSFLAPDHNRFVRELVQEKAKSFGVEVGDFVNAGNHLHIKLRAATREQFQKFLKSISGRIARQITGACRGKKFGRFWQGLAYTRVLTSRREEIRLKTYFSANRTEMVAGYAKRREFLKEFTAHLEEDRLASREHPPTRRSFEDAFASTH